MRNFKQLSDTEQQSAINYCIDIIIDNIVNSNFSLESIYHNDECDNQKEIENVEDYLKSMDSSPDKVQEKVNYMMDNEVVYEEIFESACEMAEGAWYHACEELVINVCEIHGHSTGDTNQDENNLSPSEGDGENEEEIPQYNVNLKGAKKHSIN